MSALSRLPLEVLTNIFIHIDVPTAFVCTSRAFKRIGRDHVNMVKWIEHRYYRNESIFYALYCIYDCPKEVLELLLQRGATCASWLLSRIVCLGVPNCLKEEHFHVLPNSAPHPSVKNRSVRASTARGLLKSVQPSRLRANSKGVLHEHARHDDQKIGTLIGVLPMNYPDAQGWPIEPVILDASHDRTAVESFLRARGLPATDRVLSVDLALAILLKNNDIEWWFSTLAELTGFPSFQEWSFIKPLLDEWLRQRTSDTYRCFRAYAGVWTTYLAQSAKVYPVPPAKYIFQQAGAAFYRYGYTVLDSHRLAVKDACVYNAIQLRSFLHQVARSPDFTRMIVHLLRSYRGERLLLESERFQTCYLTYIANTARVTTFPLQVGTPAAAPPAADKTALATSFRKLPLYVKHKAELDAFWLVLKIKDKLMAGMEKDTSFLRARVSYDSILHLLAYPWLSPKDVTKALQLAALYLPKTVDLVALVELAIERVLGNAFCGSHLLELASRLRDAESFIEARISLDTVDAVLIYPEIDDAYTEDLLITGLQQYQASLAVEHPEYSNIGPDSHLPLAFAILELVKNRRSTALKLVLKRAKAKRLSKIVKAYESAGVRL